MAAVNDITARDEEIKQYLNTTKCGSELDLDYFSTSQDDHLSPKIYTNTTTKSSECAKEMPKPLTLDTLTNEIFRSQSDSPSDEYVDINDMEIIKKKHNEGPQEKNIIMTRPRRKKTTKRKDDARMYFNNIFIHNFFPNQ